MSEEAPSYLNFCSPLARVQMIEVTLGLEGFGPFDVPGEDPDPDAEPKRYLRKTEESSAPSQKNVTRHWKSGSNWYSAVMWSVTQADGGGFGDTTAGAVYRPKETTDVDPYTGLSCMDGDVGFFVTCPDPAGLDEDSATETYRRYECGSYVPGCDGSEGDTDKVEYEVSLSDEYTLDDVEHNVDGLLNRLTFGEIQTWGVKAVWFPNTALASEFLYQDAGTDWSAAYFRSESGVTKRKIRVEFLEDGVRYTKKTPSDPEGTVFTADKGDTVEIDPPDEEGKIEIHVCQVLFDCVRVRASSELSTEGERTVEEMPQGVKDEFGDSYFVSADGDKFLRMREITTKENVRTSNSSFTRHHGVRKDSPIIMWKEHYTLSYLGDAESREEGSLELLKNGRLGVESESGGFDTTSSATVDCDATYYEQEFEDDPVEEYDRSWTNTVTQDTPSDSFGTPSRLYSFPPPFVPYIDPVSCLCNFQTRDDFSEVKGDNPSSAFAHGPTYLDLSSGQATGTGEIIRSCGESEWKNIKTFDLVFSGSSSSGQPDTWNVTGSGEETQSYTNVVTSGELSVEQSTTKFLERPCKGDYTEESESEDLENETCSEITYSGDCPNGSKVTQEVDEFEWEIEVHNLQDALEGHRLRVTMQIFTVEYDDRDPYCPKVWAHSEFVDVAEFVVTEAMVESPGRSHSLPPFPRTGLIPAEEGITKCVTDWGVFVENLGKEGE